MPDKTASERELTAMERLLRLNQKGTAPKSPRVAEPDVRHLPLDALIPNPEQPRRAFDDASIDELAESIRSRGLIQPLLVRPHPDEDDRFEIVVGERRFIAARRAGLDSVPCSVRKLDQREVFILSVAENVAREDLNPIDEAAAYRRMLDDEFAANQGEIAQLVGVHRTRVSRKLKLLELDPRIQQSVHQDMPDCITLTHLEELSRLTPGDEQHRLYLDAAQKKLSTRELHARVESLLAPRTQRPPTVSKSVVPLEDGARVLVYPAKYVLRIPREAGEEIDLNALAGQLERAAAQLRARD
jgi:ParB family chromosome partitioning protein